MKTNKSPEDWIEGNREMAKSLIDNHLPKVPGEVSYIISEKLQQIARHEGLRPFIWTMCCTGCGRDNLPAPIIEYFHFDITKVKCYQCQGMSR